MVEQHLFMGSVLPHPDALSDSTTSPASNYSTQSSFTSCPPSAAYNQSDLLAPGSPTSSSPTDHSHTVTRRSTTKLWATEAPIDRDPNPSARGNMLSQWDDDLETMNIHHHQTGCCVYTAPQTRSDYYATAGHAAPSYWQNYGVSTGLQLAPIPQVSTPYYMTPDRLPYDERGGHSLSMITQSGEWHGVATMEEPVPQHVSGMPAYHSESSCSSPFHAQIKHEPTSVMSSPSLSPGRHSAARDSEDRITKSSRKSSKKSSRMPSKRSIRLSRPERNPENGALPGPWSNSSGEECHPALKEDCPEEAEFLFKLEFKYRERKGKDMWKKIHADYVAKYGETKVEKAALQMKLRRARTKHIRWLEEDQMSLNSNDFGSGCAAPALLLLKGRAQTALGK
ncbi:hypothetical protein E4U53_003495 [Claviceps sorghi]|nr:hypothetical protein E4U53_003495 [Claviceps sorghi]